MERLNERVTQEALAFDEFLAASEEFRELKVQTASELPEGLDEETVQAEPRAATRDMASELRHAFGCGDWLVNWLLGRARTGGGRTDLLWISWASMGARVGRA